ncbi:MAG TPA: hypothetical protein VL099_00195 [Candidatus Binatia bacterium]|nr:hypothetical protein [Candidatus Binatia bacterium]
MRVARKCAAVVAALGLAVPVWAQFGMGRGPNMRGIFHPVVGEGSAYQMQGRGEGPKDFEVAVVGKEDYQGQTGYWLEMTFADARSGMGASKMLMVMEGPNPGTKRMIVMMNGQAYEFPMNSPMMAGRAPKPEAGDIRNDKTIVDAGKETITVPAGTFVCEHYKASDGSSEMWISDKVSPWGLVKSVSKDSTMVLSRQITDAKTKITGPVKPFNPMEMMQQRPNQ